MDACLRGGEADAHREDPARHMTKLRSVEASKLRIGDHRLILCVDWERSVLHFLTLGHRSTVYR